ncbi:hypothetical protein BB558_002023 [Smittium angustum]|uniref:Peptidase S1 domain-containing protein n=1 Tax=Smittium angustum TaxID=133377 RepID=A0A2U1J9R5_SMIAN|nr:hypothetical protein BB558_002023 [Smittium angustum]
MICGGTLLMPDVVVTAAHCVYNELKQKLPVSSFYISVGDSRYLNEESDTYKIETINIHPEFDIESLDNDLAIVTLLENISNQKVTYSKIFNKEVNGDMAVEAAGWGAVSNESEKTPETLMSVELRVSFSKNCKALNYLWDENKKSVCTSNVNGKDTCFGDSGGPLLYTGDIKRPIVGIISYGASPEQSEKVECGIDGGVAYFTNLNYYIPWIKSIPQVFNEDMLFFNDQENFPQKKDRTEEINNQKLPPNSKESSSDGLKTTKNGINCVKNGAYILALSKSLFFYAILLLL